MNLFITYWDNSSKPTWITYQNRIFFFPRKVIHQNTSKADLSCNLTCKLLIECTKHALGTIIVAFRSSAHCVTYCKALSA